MPTPNKKTTARRRRTSISKQIKFWASVIITVILYFMQQQGKPLSKPDNMDQNQVFDNVSIASIYDGDTFKINLNLIKLCSESILFMNTMGSCFIKL